MPFDQRIVDAARAIIERGSCAVSKPVRAGFTTSGVMACEQMDRSVLYVAPTRRILLETFNASSDKAIRILANWECGHYTKLIKAHPILIQLPIPLPNCKKCKKELWCELRVILRDPDPRTMGLTYAKLQALMLSNSAMATEIKTKIEKAEVILFDEAHLISLPKVVSVRAFQSLTIPEQYSALVQAYVRWLELCQNYATIIQELMQDAETNHTSKHLARNVANTSPVSWHDLKIAWSQLIDLALNGLLPDEQIIQLRDIVTLVGATVLSVSFVGAQSEEEDEIGAVYLSTGQTLLWQALREFLVNRRKGSSVIFGSATLFEPYKGFFQDLVGSEVQQAVFPDLRNATQKMELIPDTWTLGARDFKSRIPRIVATVKAIAEREKKSIIVYAPNIAKAAVLEREFKKAGIRHLQVDHYRSDGTIGVEHEERICITIGLAQIPSNVYDSSARGNTPDERFLDSRRLRLLSVHAATWQAVNRVRDPAGQADSRVYFIGCRLEEVKQVATWGTNRTLELVTLREFKHSISEISKTPVFAVKVDEAIETPKIQGETKNISHSERRCVKDYVANIELNCIFSQNHSIYPIHKYRENGVKLGIYNFPHNESELELTADSLYLMFCHRTDCHIEQIPGWCKFNSPITVDLLKEHVEGKRTIGTYEIGLDNTVTWGIFDFDVHAEVETTPFELEGLIKDTGEQRERLIAVLREYGIPFLLEASGTPYSYHVWIFFAPTKTANAWHFMRQIKAEAGLPKDAEVWPKQSRLDKNSRYGNQVKVPICFNRKSKGRSAFLDPDTREPLEGLITHPGRVHLLEIPDLDETKITSIPKVRSTKMLYIRPGENAYVNAAFRSEIEDLRSTTKNRNIRLTRATKQCYSWVINGWLSESEVDRALLNATDLSREEAERTIESAKRNVEPRDPPEHPNVIEVEA